MAAAPADPKAIDGKKWADAIRAEIKASLAAQRDRGQPRLAVVLVGNAEDSAVYVRMKGKAAEEVGIQFELVHLPADATTETVSAAVKELALRTDGLIVQLPMPKQIDEQAVLSLIPPAQDVDGLHTENMGRLACRSGPRPLHVPCTPKGCIELLRREGVTIDGKDAVVLGRSALVGMPVALMLLEHNATVTICHSRTQNLADKVRNADIVIAAIGKPEFVKGDWIKPGAVVIDVGINSIADATRKSGKRLVGDVDYEAAKVNASRITPVPGGAGPMTVAMLMQATATSWERSLPAKK